MTNRTSFTGIYKPILRLMQILGNRDGELILSHIETWILKQHSRIGKMALSMCLITWFWHWYPYHRKREPIPQSCLLTSVHVLCHVVYMHNKLEKVEWHNNVIKTYADSWKGIENLEVGTHLWLVQRLPRSSNSERTVLWNN